MVLLFLTCDYRLGMYKLFTLLREKGLGRKSQLHFKTSLPIRGLGCSSSTGVPCSVINLGQGMDMNRVGAILAVESSSKEASPSVPCVSDVTQNDLLCCLLRFCREVTLSPQKWHGTE